MPDKKSSNDPIAKSLSRVLITLWELLVKIYRVNRSFFVMCFVLISILLHTIIKTINSDLVTVLAVTIIFLILSFFTYFKNRSYVETGVIFATGIFTAFSINWDIPKFTIFLFLSVILSVMIFLINSLTLASKLENMIIYASTNYSKNLDIGDTEIKKAWSDCESLPYKSLIKLDARFEMFLYLASSKVEPSDIPFIFEKSIMLVNLKRVDHIKAIEVLTAIYLAENSEKDDFKEKIDIFVNNLMNSKLIPEKYIAKFINNEIL